MKKAVFAGTFDPFTLGHYDIVKRASLLFDKVVVAVAKQHGKANVRALKNRIEIAELSVFLRENSKLKTKFFRAPFFKKVQSFLQSFFQKSTRREE